MAALLQMNPAERGIGKKGISRINRRGVQSPQINRRGKKRARYARCIKWGRTVHFQEVPSNQYNIIVPLVGPPLSTPSPKRGACSPNRPETVVPRLSPLPQFNLLFCVLSWAEFETSLGRVRRSSTGNDSHRNIYIYTQDNECDGTTRALLAGKKRTR